jgi:hypothetical protein
MTYREETTWVIRVEVGAEFAEDYDGEQDGYAWRDRFHRELQPRVAAAVLRELGNAPGWTVRTGNRGMSARDELLVIVELDERKRGLRILPEGGSGGGHEPGGSGPAT